MTTEYLYPPIYKYIIFFVIILSFLKFYTQITSDKYLLICLLFTFIIMVLDYMMIYSDSSILNTHVKNSNNQNIETNDALINDMRMNDALMNEEFDYVNDKMESSIDINHNINIRHDDLYNHEPNDDIYEINNMSESDELDIAPRFTQTKLRFPTRIQKHINKNNNVNHTKRNMKRNIVDINNSKIPVNEFKSFNAYGFDEYNDDVVDISNKKQKAYVLH